MARKWVALLDWDGTIRKGFTLISWMNFLLSRDVVDSEYINKINVLFDLYHQGRLSHDALALKSAKIYAQSLRGINKRDITILAKNFVEIDINNLYGYAKDIIRFFKKANIYSIVVSGAPIEVLNEYAGVFELYKVYGLKLETDIKGYYVGTVERNPGIFKEKEKIVQKLRKKFYIVVGMGNSYSDLPILNHAFIPVVVNNPDLVLKKEGTYVEADNVNAKNLIRDIENRLRFLVKGGT